MTLRRKILLILLIIPVAMIVISIGWPGTGLEMIFLVAGVPILVLNAWELFSPEANDLYFGKPKIALKKLAVDHEGIPMKNKSLIVLIILGSSLILLIVGYAWFRAYIDQVPFLYALYIFLVKLASKLWHFLTTPAIFITLFVFLMLWLFRKQIVTVVKEIKPGGYVEFSDIFNQPILTPVLEDNSPTSKTESGELNASETSSTTSWLIEHGIDGKAIQLMLDIDGKDVTKPYLLSKIDELDINSDRVPSNANKIQKAVFYRGVFEVLYGYLLPIFCSIEMKNDERVACFALKPGVREKFSERLERLNKPTESFVI
jgi:hypothetical protein